MIHSFIRKTLAVALIVALTLGHGVFAPAMAASMMRMHQSETPVNVDANVDQDDCCPACEKEHSSDHGIKGSACAAACAAMTQAALPLLPVEIVFRAERMFYSFADTASFGQSLLPDYPPPKV